MCFTPAHCVQHTFICCIFVLFRRTCWVCYGTEEDEPGNEWTCPCMCRGATKWVHQLCLQQWIDEKQRGSSSVDVNCPQCQYPYQIVYPSTSVMLYTYEVGNRVVTFCAPLILAGLTASSLYWVSFTFGISSVSAALGRERSVEFFSQPDSSMAVVTLPLLPWVIMGIKVMRLEIQLLRAWYQIVSPLLTTLIKKLPVLKSTYAHSQERQKRFVPAQVSVLPFLSRCVVGTFFLPVVASSIGWALSYVMTSTSSPKRTLLVS